MLIKKAADIPSSEITPKSLYLSRRKFLAGTALAGAAVVAVVAAGLVARRRELRMRPDSTATVSVSGIRTASTSAARSTGVATA